MSYRQSVEHIKQAALIRRGLKAVANGFRKAPTVQRPVRAVVQQVQQAPRPAPTVSTPIGASPSSKGAVDRELSEARTRWAPIDNNRDAFVPSSQTARMHQRNAVPGAENVRRVPWKDRLRYILRLTPRGAADEAYYTQNMFGRPTMYISPRFSDEAAEIIENHEKGHGWVSSVIGAKQYPGQMARAWKEIQKTLDEAGLAVHYNKNIPWENRYSMELLPMEAHAGFYRTRGTRPDIFYKRNQRDTSLFFDELEFLRPQNGMAFSDEFLRSRQGRALAALGEMTGHGYRVLPVDDGTKAIRYFSGLYQRPGVLSNTPLSSFNSAEKLISPEELRRLELWRKYTVPTLGAGATYGLYKGWNVLKEADARNRQPQQ